VGEQPGGGPGGLTVGQVLTALLGGGAVFVGLAVVMGYLYVRTYLEDLGIPGRVLAFSPDQYALASSPLLLLAATSGGAAACWVLLWRYLAERAPATGFGLQVVVWLLAAVAFMAAGLTVVCTTSVVVGLSDQVLPQLSPNGLRALYFLSLAALTVVILLLPGLVALPPPGLAPPGWRLGFAASGAAFVLYMVALAFPVAIGHIDARLTLDTDQGTQRATLFLIADGSLGGPWGSAEAGRIEDARLIFVCEDYIYLLYRPPGGRGPATVHAIPAGLVSRIDFFPGR
jgi:hypothetical protein